MSYAFSLDPAFAENQYNDAVRHNTSEPPPESRGLLDVVEQDLLNPVTRATAGQGAVLLGLAGSLPFQGIDKVAGTELTDLWMKEIVDPAVTWQKSLKPDPRTTNLAENVLDGVLSFLPSAILTGPVGAGVLPGITEVAENVQEGKSLETSFKMGGTTALANAIGTALPASFITKSLPLSAVTQRVGTGIAANVGMGAIERETKHNILANAGYQEQANQYQAWDKTGLAIDAVFGGVFGRYEAFRRADADAKLFTPKQEQIDAALTANQARHASELAPGIPTNPAAANAHADALNAHIDALVRGDESPASALINRQAEIPEDLISTAGNRLSRGDRQALDRELADIEFKLSRLDQQEGYRKQDFIDAVLEENPRMPARKQAALAEQRAAEAQAEGRADIEAMRDRLLEQRNADDEARAAYAEISRIEQQHLLDHGFLHNPARAARQEAIANEIQQLSDGDPTTLERVNRQQALNDKIISTVEGLREQRARDFADRQTLDDDRTGEAVYDDVMRQLQETGVYDMGKDQAFARLMQQVMVNQGKAHNMTPGAFYRQFGAKIVSDVVDNQAFGQPLKSKTPLPEGQSRITVDGTDRPTLSSNGQPIHSTVEGVENFWRWFGDSKVVDDQGRPLVVYHGTSADIKIFKPKFFYGEEESKKILDWYRDRKRKNLPVSLGDFRMGNFFSPSYEYADNYTGESGSIYPVYIRSENPAYINGFGKKIGGQVIEKTVDALVIKNSDTGSIEEIAVIDSIQIKSATGNRGSFDPNDPNILHQAAKPFIGSLSDMAAHISKVPDDVAIFANLGKASDAAAAKIKEATGIDIDGARIIAYGSDVKSDLRDHPETTSSDWANAHTLLEEHDLAGRSIAQRGAQGERITLVKNMTDGEGLGAIYEVQNSTRLGRRLVLKGLFRGNIAEMRNWFKSNTREKAESGFMRAGGNPRLPNNDETSPTQTTPDSRNSIDQFDQTDAGKGAYSPDTRTIGLFQSADASTFLHESGHYYLDLYQDLIESGIATGGVRKDFDTLLNWFGVKDFDTWSRLSIDQQRPYHEQFAKGFETYLSEGKAPTPELKSLFDQFAQWLKQVYSDIKSQLGVELTDDVRGVMDRLINGDQKTKAAKPESPELNAARHSITERGDKVINIENDDGTVTTISAEEALRLVDDEAAMAEQSDVTMSEAIACFFKNGDRV